MHPNSLQLLGISIPSLPSQDLPMRFTKDDKSYCYDQYTNTSFSTVWSHCRICAYEKYQNVHIFA